MPLRKTWALTALIPLIAFEAVRSQGRGPIIEVRDDDACRKCTIELKRIATLGSPTDSVSPDVMATVARDSKGNYYVGPVDTPGAVLIYNATGTIIGSIGRRGQGPGEFIEVGIVKVAAGDTLYVLDAALWRLTVFSPDRRLIRTVPLPQRTIISDFVPVATGDVVVTMPLSTAEGIGLPLHVVNTKGQIVRSFGSVSPVIRPDAPVDRRVIAAAGTRGVWQARPHAYEIERWLVDGTPDRTLVRRARWFPPYEPVLRPPSIRVAPPKPALRGLLETGDSLVWVRLDVASSDYKPTWSDARGKAPPITSLDEYLNFFDTVLEAVNPITGRLLATTRVDTPLQRFFGRDLAFTHREDADGYRYLDIWQLRLVAPSGVAW